MNEQEAAVVPELFERAWGVRVGYSRKSLNRRTTDLPEPPPEFDADQVAALRKKLKMSQAVFAAVLNVAAPLVQKWERGGRRPDRCELRLMELLNKHQKIILPLIMIDDDAPDEEEKAAPKAKPAAKKKK